MERWHFFIDSGGTFTDAVARDPQGRLRVLKLLSENPGQYADAPLEAIRRLLGIPDGAPIPSGRIASVRMGTTLATNALLERKGVPVGLLTTRGFRDLLAIGYQDRPDLFALNITKPEQLAQRTIEIDERVLDGGKVDRALDEDEVRSALRQIQNEGIESLAVVFLHSYAHPDHERRTGALARTMGFQHVSLSHEVAREIKAVPRGDTTLVDAYLTPLLRDYVARLRKALGPDVLLRFMQSDGGLVRAEGFSGKDAILSGPAGGVVAAGDMAVRSLDSRPIIAFDMGGTSTDVSRWDGAPERVYETRIAGVRLKAPMTAIETVAAGGGSILRFEQGRFLVGPESAGANPGPACYGRGGPATVTDANLVLGRIQPDYFPAVFGHDANQPLDTKAAYSVFDTLCQAVSRHTNRTWTIEEVAAGFVRVANESMVKPIKEVSVSRGNDVRDHALVCFGGAGAQHACAIAESLGIETILLHPLAGVLSAYGMGLADVTCEHAEPILEPLCDKVAAQAGSRFQALEADAIHSMSEEGIAPEHVSHTRIMELRYAGTDSALAIEADASAATLATRFTDTHRRQFGYAKPDQPLEAVNLRVRSSARNTIDLSHATADSVDRDRADQAPAAACIYFDRVGPDGRRTLTPYESPVFLRSQLPRNGSIEGPALVIEDTSTIVVDPGWHAQQRDDGTLVMHRVSEDTPHEALHLTCDPVRLEVFNHLFMSIAGQMGKRLENVAHSVNIKERLDFSCALFTPGGNLVANAPHIPVHLGAMSESVKAVIAEHGAAMRPGDVYATNDPYHGGSHLPDVTVVTPVFDSGGGVKFFVANRGHHADIGGISPGSMPPFSESINDEGVVLRTVALVRSGQFADDDIRALLSAGPHPARNIPERMSDLHAQIAANQFGVALLTELCDRCGLDGVHACMRHVRANAAEAMREVLRAYPDGTFSFEDRLDNGARIAVTITIEGDTAMVDFTGTDKQLPGNLNAPPAVVISAVLYCFRTLIGKSVPLNSGCLDPITVIIPEGSLLRPRPPAAVVGGNVETSMRVVDVIFGALGVAGASQGTMNNLTFGTEEWGYYETIGGGAGAGRGFDGASAVHTHMTNTRITDPEVLEHRYPVILRAFNIRHGSGGDGRWRGGDGIRRVIEFREAMSCAMLSERRVYEPYGLEGGAAGACGRNMIVVEGEPIDLGGAFQRDVTAGTVLIIETPGGGGFGAR